MSRRIDASTVVVIVGASSGIGRAAAYLFARRGARLVLAARSLSTLQQVADRCRELGGDAEVVVADIARPEDAARIADEAERLFGRIDVWVAAASAYGYGELDTMPAGEARTIIDTNLHGTIDQLRAALPALRRTHGVIV